MKWVKAPDELKVLLENAMEGIECEKRPMFGYPAYFVNKNMFAGLFQTFVFLRLSPHQTEVLRKQHPSIALLEPMPGRPMKDYHTIPEAIFRDPKAFHKVIAEAADYTRTLPAKTRKPSSRSTRKKA